MMESRARITKSRALLDDIRQCAGHPDVRRPLPAHRSLEIEALVRLQQMTMRFVDDSCITALLGDALDVLLMVTDAPLGNIQLLNQRTGMLRIVAQQGFRREFLDFFAEVPAHGSACGTALRRRRRVIVPDVLIDPAFTEDTRRAMLSANARAVQSTPLVGLTGKVLGVVSTHYREPRVASKRALRIVDFYAHHLATLIESKRVPPRAHAGAGVDS